MSAEGIIRLLLFLAALVPPVLSIVTETREGAQVSVQQLAAVSQPVGDQPAQPELPPEEEEVGE